MFDEIELKNRISSWFDNIQNLNKEHIIQS